MYISTKWDWTNSDLASELTITHEHDNQDTQYL